MTSTLIVRDAVSLVLGEMAAHVDYEDHLRARVAAATELPSERLEECLATIAPDAGEGAQPDVLGAALVLTLAHPKAAAAHRMSAPVVGRRLAAWYESADDVEFAFAVLHLVGDFAPGNAAIERATASLMRRQGMVQELVERYLDRAQRLLDEGENHEAIPWLREVLLLDRSRKDVARMIRDLRFDEVESKRARSRRVRLAGVVLGLSAIATLATMRELKVKREFAEIPAAQAGDLETLRFRLDSIEAFVTANPIWHGALGALQERSDLRVEIDRIMEKEAAHADRAEASRRRKDSLADNARSLGRRSAEQGDYQAALSEFEKALQLASDSWPHADRTQRDVEAIRAHLGEEGT